MTRLGKIARLPRKVRDELNVRLQDGEVGRSLVEWLNGLPAARAVLKEKFGGRPISEQNLSEWKQGGYEDWVRQQEDGAYASMLAERSGDLEAEAGETRLEERLAALMAVALARLWQEAEELPSGAEKHQRILEVARALGQLRRQSHQAERLRIERDRWAEKKSEICQREAKEASEAAHNEVIWQMTKAQFPSLYGKPAPKAEGKRPRKRRGGGEAKGDRRPGAPKGRGKPQDERAEIQDVAESSESNRIKANQSESDQIKPNQTSCEEVAQPGIDLSAAPEGGGREDGPTQSNPVQPDCAVEGATEAVAETGGAGD